MEWLESREWKITHVKEMLSDPDDIEVGNFEGEGLILPGFVNPILKPPTIKQSGPLC